jgi:hypothetical protein
MEKLFSQARRLTTSIVTPVQISQISRIQSQQSNPRQSLYATTEIECNTRSETKCRYLPGAVRSGISNRMSGNGLEFTRENNAFPAEFAIRRITKSLVEPM